MSKRLSKLSISKGNKQISRIEKDSYGQPKVLGVREVAREAQTVVAKNSQGATSTISVNYAVNLVEWKLQPWGGTGLYRELPYHTPAPVILDERDIHTALNIFGAELVASNSTFNTVMHSSAGGATMIKVLASDFIPNDDDLSYNAYIHDDISRFAVRSAGNPSPLYYFTDIPRGTQVESGEFYTYNTYENVTTGGSTGETNITLYEGFINFDYSESIKHLNSTNQGQSTLTFSLREPIAWSPTNFIVVKYVPKLNSDRLYGGFLALGPVGPQPVPLPQAFCSNGTQHNDWYTGCGANINDYLFPGIGVYEEANGWAFYAVYNEDDPTGSDPLDTIHNSFHSSYGGNGTTYLSEVIARSAAYDWWENLTT